ncbi:MAG: imidazole glycerol phosphate synthase subunit HisH [Gallionellales bacterium 35-53-114]|jgi:glutamine amidotransferase|nr:MAG: imidazole glycerol phosphate synthase subunit HisH [Gallionellales bacterium 35-53-114]OYZ63449.1 MAG: imidazole glycerol phosphate synthase subunit HisH [Gallionellales bacterium 24-53-125]OZB10938.1 MAG: imidazole glycerol phosphate synthase subunit HisH [Gallionellales bacterium 39-52-133]HQS58879.1 imidazole glycerol phosphate synthase subunit HisH [Gallionellaceae bacterium]HQS75736.1 imidazole glycerol phosphate synthase subunit HisH [Gallionellaceae bacterium]
MNAPEVVVIDYGVGNLLSVQRGLEHCGAKVVLTAEPDQIFAAKRVVLPGVGAFDNAMQALERLNLVKVIQELATRPIPLLGICLGMQLLLEESEEFGITAGLGLIPGRVIPVPTQTLSGEKQKIPHIGWNSLHPSSTSVGWDGTILQDNSPGDAAYFVHSFMAVPSDPSHRIAECRYGGHLISATIGRDQITGCQFHPEKSGEVGLKILRRFITS